MKSYKKDLLDRLATLAPDSTKTQLAEHLDLTLEAIQELTTEPGQTLTLRGFGTFKNTLRPARTARNPQTGEPVAVPEKSVRTFKASK